MTQNTIKTTCAYCGVGCGVEATIEDLVSHQISIKGDQTHPSNFGSLCSKGAALADTVTLEGRLLYPELMVRKVTGIQLWTMLQRVFPT